MKNYNKDNVILARSLRKNMTPWERKLWYNFLRTYSPRFQRQKLLGNYIVDFYCSKAKIIIELDGGGHFEPEQIRKDNERTVYLESTGLKVIRISNTAIDKNFNEVCEYIHRMILETTDKASL